MGLACQRLEHPAARLRAFSSRYTNTRKVKLTFRKRFLCSNPLLTPQGSGPPRGLTRPRALLPPGARSRPAASHPGTRFAVTARQPVAEVAPLPQPEPRRRGPDGSPRRSPGPAPRGTGSGAGVPDPPSGHRVAARTERPVPPKALGQKNRGPPGLQRTPMPPLQPGHLRVSCGDTGAMNSA